MRQESRETSKKCRRFLGYHSSMCISWSDQQIQDALCKQCSTSRHSILIKQNKAKRNLFVCLLACLSGMAGHALYGMATCFVHTGVTFDAENDRPGPGSLRGHFEVARSRVLILKALF